MTWITPLTRSRILSKTAYVSPDFKRPLLFKAKRRGSVNLLAGFNEIIMDKGLQVILTVD